MNRMQKLVILLLLISCIAVFDASAEEIAIKAEDGTDLPDSIYIDETFTVLITADGVHVGAGTNVVFTLPQVGGDPIYVPTDADGKARYKPLITGTLQIWALDGVDMVAEATVNVVTAETQTLDRVEISPTSADLLIGATEKFNATCYDADSHILTGCTLTWTCDSSAVGTIDSSSGLFTACGVGTATVTVTATHGSVTETDTAIVNVSALPSQVELDNESSFSTTVDAGDTADISVTGTFDNNVTGNISLEAIADPEGSVDKYQFTGDDQALIGLNAIPDANITAELANGNDTIRIEMCYNTAELKNKDIDSATLVIWRFDGTEWVKMVAGTDPCLDNGRDGNCVWIEVNNLSTFVLVGTKTISDTHRGSGGGGGGGGTYPPDWFETPTPTVTPAQSSTTPDTTATTTKTAKQVATKKPTVKSTAASSGGDTTAEAPKKKGLPGFEGVFVIAGLLAIAYVMMRQKR